MSITLTYLINSCVILGPIKIQRWLELYNCDGFILYINPLQAQII